MPRKKVIFFTVLLIAFLALFAVFIYYFKPKANVSYFAAGKKLYYPGEPVSLTAKLKNAGNRKEIFRLNFRMQNKKNNLIYQTVKSIELNAGEESFQVAGFEIPSYSKFDVLEFDCSLDVWVKNFGKFRQNLDSKFLESAFLIPVYSEHFTTLDKNYWIPANYTFPSNKGYFDPENVSLEKNFLQLKSPANSFNGSGVESKNIYGYGSFSAKIKCPYAPGTLCTFFLYQSDPQKKSDEIDIEIYNDGSGKVDFVTYSSGIKKNYRQIFFPFNPSEDFHEYRIDYYPDRVNFYADNMLFNEWRLHLPSKQMKIISNFWWPKWMSYPPMKIDSYMKIKQIDYFSKEYYAEYKTNKIN